MSNSCSYRFISSSLSDTQYNREYSLVIRQQPDRAKINIMNDRERRCIEPPPIIQMICNNCSEEEEECRKYLYSPFYFMVVKLLNDDDLDGDNSPPLSTEEYLSGPTVSSPYKLRDIDNGDAGFFVFSGLGVKKQGIYRLHFSFFEVINDEIYNQKTITSNAFSVYPPRQFPGPLESTFLSRMFSDQGVRMRTRKEHRYQTTSTHKRKSEVHLNNHKRINPNCLFKSKTVQSPAYASENVYFGQWHSKSEYQQTEPETNSSYRTPQQQQQQQQQKDKTILPPLSIQISPSLSKSTNPSSPSSSSSSSSLLPSIKDMLFHSSFSSTSSSTYSAFIPENVQLANQLPPLRCILKPEMMHAPLNVPLNRPFFGNSYTRD